MLPRDVLAGGEADDVPRAVVGPRTVSGYPVSHRSPLASSYAAVITVRGLRTPSTGWNPADRGPDGTHLDRRRARSRWISSARQVRASRQRNRGRVGPRRRLTLRKSIKIAAAWGRTDLPMSGCRGVRLVAVAVARVG